MFNNQKYQYLIIYAFLIGFTLLAIAMLFNSETFYALFFYKRNEYFMDLINVVGFAIIDNPYQPEFIDGSRIPGSTYSPFTFLLVRPFALLADYAPLNNHIMLSKEWHTIAIAIRDTLIVKISVVIYMLILHIIFYLGLLKLLNKRCWSMRIAVFLITFCSLPILFYYHRTNVIIFSLIGITYFLCYYQSPKKQLRYLALISLAIASVVKLSPAVLSLLLLKEKRYRDFIIFGLIAIFLEFAPFLIYDQPFIYIIEYIKNVLGFSKGFNLHILLTIPLYFFILSCIFLAMKTNSQTKAIEFLIFSFTLINGLGYYYVQTYLLIPYVLFLSQERYDKLSKYYFILFLFIFIIYPSFFVKTPFGQASISLFITSFFIGLLCVSKVLNEYRILYFNQKVDKGKLNA